MAQNQAVLVLRQAKIMSCPWFSVQHGKKGANISSPTVNQYILRKCKSTKQGSRIYTDLQKRGIEFGSFYI